MAPQWFLALSRQDLDLYARSVVLYVWLCGDRAFAFYLADSAGSCVFFLFFFFQAEDGIRDLIVTGVQTCALPISPTSRCNPTRDRTFSCSFVQSIVTRFPRGRERIAATGAYSIFISMTMSDSLDRKSVV